MKCSEELVCIRVSRAADGLQCICAWLYHCARFPFFNSWCQVPAFPICHVNVGIRLTPPPKHVFTIRCMALPRLRLFFIHDAKLLFIGPINEIRVPYANGAESFSLVLLGNDFLAGGRELVRGSRGAVHRASKCQPTRLLYNNTSYGGEVSIALSKAFYLKCLPHRQFTADSKSLQ